MKGKNLLWLLGLGIVVIVVGGCGDVPIESKIYHYPNWTPDGKIISIKNVIRETKGMWGNYDITYDKSFITTISSDGATEADLFEINDDAYPSEVVCAPDGKKIGYISHPGYKLSIINYDGTGKYIIPEVSGVSYFDWSPDSTRIVYSSDNRELHVANIDGTNNIIVTSEASGPVSWRVGNRIAYGFLYLIDQNGSNNQYLVDGGKPQIMNLGKIMYYSDLNSPGDYKIKSIYQSGTEESIVLNSYSRNTMKLSFDNSKIVGGALDQQDIVGIWIINIDGTGSKRLR